MPWRVSIVTFFTAQQYYIPLGAILGVNSWFIICDLMVTNNGKDLFRLGPCLFGIHVIDVWYILMGMYIYIYLGCSLYILTGAAAPGSSSQGYQLEANQDSTKTLTRGLAVLYLHVTVSTGQKMSDG